MTQMMLMKTFPTNEQPTITLSKDMWGSQRLSTANTATAGQGTTTDPTTDNTATTNPTSDPTDNIATANPTADPTDNTDSKIHRCVVFLQIF
jgi:hypothetical protein